MARAVELDRSALPGMSAGSWSMMRHGLVTPAAERWHEVKQLAAQAREIAAEFKAWAQGWLDRLVGGMQERTVADGPSMRQREPQTALERLQAAQEGRATADSPQTALERLQAARDGRDRDTGADVVCNEERAGAELQKQDAERERVLEQERTAARERDRSHERDDGYSR